MPSKQKLSEPFKNSIIKVTSRFLNPVAYQGQKKKIA